jgi:LacI family transcriptional regulator
VTVTLKDIAERAGVSTTTVSRILNGRETGVPIREETREKVLSVAAELGYRPNIMARALRGSRSSLIGVIAQNITSLFHSQVLRGLNATTVGRGYRMFLGHVQRQSDIAIDYGSMFEQSHADGILVVGEWMGDQEALQVLLRRHQYIVGITDRITARGFPGVYGNSQIGAQLAMEHLWGLGHRKIICVTDTRIQDGKMRAGVYRQFMAEHGAEENIQVHITPRTFQASCEAGLQIFSTDERPTAIFAATDAIAIGLMQAAFQLGVSIPRQVSIVGYDDLDIAAYFIPPLTTVRQFGVEMGQAAANMLLDMIEQERSSDQVEDVVLTPSLIVRQSTAPVSNNGI